jgi:hypothetical protein
VTGVIDAPVPGVLTGLRLAPELAEATAALVASGAPFPFATRPVLLPAAARDRMAATCAAFIDGVDALHRAYRDDRPGLTALLRRPAHLAAMWDALPADDWAVIARPDILVAGERTLLIDVNASSYAGLFPLHDMLVRAQGELADATGRPRPPSPPPTVPLLADLLRARTADPDGLVVLAYFAEENVDGRVWANWYYRMLAWELRRCGLQVQIATAEELAVSGDRVTLRGRPVGLVYRFFPVPPPDTPEWTVMSRLVDAARAGGVALFTDFRGELFAVKVVLALLSDERTRPLLPGPVADRLRTALPWTRLLEQRSTEADGHTVDLVSWVLAHRETTVLKPAGGSGGDRVHIGRECSGAEWAAAVDAALADPLPWLAQELVPPDLSEVETAEPDGSVTRQRLPVVYGAFLLDRRLVGAIGRHGVGGVGRLNINGHLGVIPTPVTWAAQPSTRDKSGRR